MNEFVKELGFSKGKYREQEIFIDLIYLTTYFIQNNIMCNLSYEKKYNDILNKYNKEEQEIMQHLIIKLVILYDQQEKPIDILGYIFHLLNVNSKELGQFFTPQHLQELGAELLKIDEEEIKEKGYTNFCEPSSGSAGMALAYANKMKNEGYNYHKQLCVTAKDLDVLCSCMSYVQLSLYDIPAIVINGDSLIGTINFKYYTPQFVYNNWFNKLNASNSKER